MWSLRCFVLAWTKICQLKGIFGIPERVSPSKGGWNFDPVNFSC